MPAANDWGICEKCNGASPIRFMSEIIEFPGLRFCDETCKDAWKAKHKSRRRLQCEYAQVFQCGKVVRVAHPLNPRRQIATSYEHRPGFRTSTKCFLLQSGRELRGHAQRIADEIGLPVSLRKETMYVKKTMPAFADRLWRQIFVPPFMFPIFPSRTSVWRKAQFFSHMFCIRLTTIAAHLLRVLAQWMQRGETIEKAG